MNTTEWRIPNVFIQVDEAIGRYGSIALGPPPHALPDYGGILGWIAARVTEEVGVPVVVTWTPNGLRGYPLPQTPCACTAPPSGDTKKGGE